MNFREVMNELDKIWDSHNKQKIRYPNYAHQYLPENWKVKICTEDHGWGATPGVFIKGIYEGFDWDSETILITTDQPIWQSSPTIPIHKWRNDINGVSYDCSECGGLVGRTDKFCKYCGKQFSGEIKDGVIFKKEN